MAHDFSEIEPYRDDQVRAALLRVVADRQCLDLIGQFLLPRVWRWFAWLLRPLLHLYLRLQARRVNSVLDFQLLVERYLSRLIDTTIDDFTVGGLDTLDISKPCLFMSNHRDIALDPALVNFALYHRGGSTLRIAIGDNLLSKPFASDLMRANKSFIVKRSVSGPRELMKSLKNLSAYIWHSLTHDREHIWIAQREGRAKDGIDATDAAIIKMLTIARPKSQPFSDYVEALNIVPVSISYQYDPCDAAKAHELRMRAEEGDYEKEEHEDLASIGQGIAGYKGNVHLQFGAPLHSDYGDADAVAEAIDRAVACNYHLHDSNWLAYEWLEGVAHLSESQRARLQSIDTVQRQQFQQRMADLPDEETLFALDMYANPVRRQLTFVATPAVAGVTPSADCDQDGVG